MALQDELKALYGFIVSCIRQIFGIGSTHFRYTRELLIGVGLCVVMSVSYVGYRWFALSRDQTAQKAFSEYVQDYQMALKENNQQEWDRVAALFEYGRNQYRSSSLSPYFLVMQSDIQLRQGKQTEAIETINQALLEISDSKMITMLKIKQALIQLDSPAEAIQQAGVQNLISLARDVNAEYQDMALFYLGRYYWAHNEIDEAKKMWQELVDGQWLDKANQSSWVQEARAALQQLSK